MKKRAELDIVNPPGQIVTSPYPSAETEGYGFTDKTLADYIARKQRAAAFDEVAKEKKLSFDQWWRKHQGRDMGVSESLAEHIWNAAQENK